MKFVFCSSIWPALDDNETKHKITKRITAQHKKFGHWQLRAPAKRNDTLSSPGDVVEAEEVKHSAFLLFSVRKGIWPIKLCIKTPHQIIKQKPANLGLRVKWPCNGRVCVCVHVYVFSIKAPKSLH